MISRRIAGWTLFTAVLALCVFAGYWLLFTTFMLYDDEGYVLISLRSYGAHGSLYDLVYTQYGPFFYVAYDLLHRLFGFAWTNTSGRWLTLAHWGGASVVCAALVWRRSRSLGATLFTLAATFAALGFMVREPMHPGGSIAFLVALAAWCGATRDISRHSWSAFAVGAIGGALALTKVNVGGFLLIAACLWLITHTVNPRVRQWGGWLGLAGVVLLPWALMRHLIAQEWVTTFAVIASVGALSAVLVARMSATPRAGLRAWLVLTAGATCSTLLTVGVVLARGTSPLALVDGVLLDPLRHPGVYFFPFAWRPGTLAISAFVFVLTLWQRARWEGNTIVRTVVVVLRFIVGAMMTAAFIFNRPMILEVFDMNYAVLLAGLFALPLRDEKSGGGDTHARQWLALLLVLQFLHAYPVAGSQIAWATFLWVPLFALGFRDAWLAEPTLFSTRPSLRKYLAAVIPVAASVLLAGRLVSNGLADRRVGEPLALPGAEAIVVPDRYAVALQILTENARVHGSTLLTLPGMFSFNLWSGLPTPTLENATHWFSLLKPLQQRQIIAKLEGDPRAVLVVQVGLLGFLSKEGFQVSGELANYLSRNFEKNFDFDGYAFWTRKGRALAALSTARKSTNSAAIGELRLDLTLQSSPNEIARMEIWELRGDTKRPHLALSSANAKLSVTPLDATGVITGAETDVTWPAHLPAGINRLGVRFAGDGTGWENWVLFLCDASGRRIGLARVMP